MTEELDEIEARANGPIGPLMMLAREDIRELVAEVRRLRAVLAFYAAEQTYKFRMRRPGEQAYINDFGVSRDIDQDNGDKAREALEVRP